MLNAVVEELSIIVELYIFSIFCCHCCFQEKSKLDWETFKDQEGIEDDLRNFNKDGWVADWTLVHVINFH